jgi:hypothetical protein
MISEERLEAARASSQESAAARCALHQLVDRICPTPNWSTVLTSLPFWKSTSTTFSPSTARPVSSVRLAMTCLACASMMSPLAA